MVEHNDLLATVIKIHRPIMDDDGMQIGWCECQPTMDGFDYAVHLAQAIRDAGESITLYRLGEGCSETRYFGDVFDEAANLRDNGHERTVESRVRTILHSGWQPAADPRTDGGLVRGWGICEFRYSGDRCVFGPGHQVDYHLCGGRKINADGTVEQYLRGWNAVASNV